MKKPAIHQFHSGSAFGDAVTNSLFYTKKLLNDLGFESNIYCEHIAPELSNEILHFSQLKSNENNILLVHHSMGHDLDEWILSLKEKIILVYHNITPAEFFPKESIFYYYSIKGREQLKMFKKISVGAIGVSQLNVDELLDIGFPQEKTKVIPLLIDYDKIINHKWNYELFDKNTKQFNILFVGRIAENKSQLELIKMFKIFLELYQMPAKLYLVGGISGHSYEEEIREFIASNSLENKVILTGKVSYEDLYAYYHLADVFVCLSEHEGFGVPLIESMIFDVPVVAYDSSNIKNTLGGGGVLFKEKNLEYIAGFLSLLANNRALRREIIKTQRDNLLKFQYDNIKYELVSFLNKLGLTKIDLTSLKQVHSIKHTEVQIEGPFDSSYSLALLNREMAKAINNIMPNQVALFSTEGYGDFEPNRKFLRENPIINEMYKKGKKANNANIVLRNLYPPRVHDAKGLVNMTNSYGWEESAFPQNFLDEFNQHLDALPVMSKYVQKVMIDNGLSIPAPVIGVGVDHLLDVNEKKVNLKTKKAFKFLHISSCFPRKGVDVLLKAYCSTFKNSDDVCLVIKTFPNPHNDVESQIEYYKSIDKNCPEIELINKDLTDEHIVSLYRQCNCLVGPSRGEGYGLPMAEAMLFDLPVITTGFGGQVDFCNNETAWLIDYDFTKAQTHMKLFNSYWVNPKWEHLSELMQNILNLSKEEIKIKTDKAKENILAHHKWKDCASRMLQAVKNIENQPIFQDNKIKLGWVSTWNTKCGIATYSKFIIDNLSKEDFDITIFANNVNEEDLFDINEEKNVKRVWNNASDLDLDSLYLSIKEAKIDILVIQFNFGFYNLYALEKLILKLQKLNIKIFITLHSVEDVDKEDFKASLGWISKTLATVERLFVHNISDLNILKSFGLVDNVTLFPHGVTKRVLKNINTKKTKLGLSKKKVIASYGFLLPHKGIKELIEAFVIVKKTNNNVHLLLVNALYPNPISNEYLSVCQKTITNLNLQEDVTMINDFLSDEESFEYLDAADFLVMPYKETQESASGAIRYALSTYKPVLCTPINIFKDVEDIIHFSKDSSIESLAYSINNLINNENLLHSKSDIQKKWIDEHDWKRLAKRFTSILKRVRKNET